MESTSFEPGAAAAPPHPARWIGTSFAVVALVFLLRIPNIVLPMGPDQGVYTTIAWGLQNGRDLYRDMFEQKLPGIYLAYLSGFSIFGAGTHTIFLLDYCAGLLTVAMVFGIGFRLRDARFGALAAAVTAFATFPAARFAYGGFLERAITESFIIPLAAAAVLCGVTAVMRERTRWVVAAGLLIGTAAVFKQTALIYLVVLTAWTWFVRDFRRARSFALVAGLAALVVPALVLAWLASRGVAGDMWQSAFEFNFAYLAVGDQSIGTTAVRFAQEIFRRARRDEIWGLGGLAAAAAVLSLQWRATPAGRAAALGVLWLGGALIATVANGPRLFTTYFIPALVPLSLLIAWLIDQTLGAAERRRRVWGFGAIALAAIMLFRSGSLSQARAATWDDAQRFFGRTPSQEYLQRFRSRGREAFNAATNERLAAYVAANTSADETVFVFGMTAGTYFSSRRMPASRFLWAYAAVSEMLPGPEFTTATLAAELERNSPRYIILQRSNGDSFTGWRASEAFQAPPLQALIEKAYSRETEIGDFVLYRKIGQ
jgi:hypothetical protein